MKGWTKAGLVAGLLMWIPSIFLLGTVPVSSPLRPLAALGMVAGLVTVVAGVMLDKD